MTSNSKDIRINKHFGIKKVHTEIKHNIFEKTLITSLSIANKLCRAGDTYTYIDLYSGKGIFEDGTPGSPLIAAKAALNMINNSPIRFSFDKIRFILIDKEEANIRSLLEQFDSSQPGFDKLEIIHEIGEWETFTEEIRSYLQESTWGFIFVDPFSTELELDKLKNLIANVCRFKDILVFANFNTLARQRGRRHVADIKRVCNFLDITEAELFKNEFTATFKNAVQNKFSGFSKDFVLSAAIPISVKGKIRNSDYFYLILSTSSTGVADAFLREYARNIESYRKEAPPESLSLFEPPSEPHDNILTVLRKHREISLFELLINLYNDFFSWKNADTTKIPTSNNIQKAINDLSIKELIVLDLPDRFVYRRDKRKIKSDIFGRKEYLQKGRIRLK